MTSLVWFVTGCSSGFGEELVHAILARGDKVIATARRAEERLQDLKSAGAAILDLDISSDQVKLNEVMNEALKIYGRIDVLVNNAAYSEASMIEETNNETILKGFQTNFLGPLGVTRALLPHFRSRKAGKVLFMSSIGASLGAAAGGVYNASKAALETAVGSLRQEVSPFGIECSIIIPGFFRTKMFSPSNFKFRDSKNPIPEYEEMVKATRAWISDVDGKQSGDPKKAMEALVDVVRGEGRAVGKELPFRLPLGADAVVILREEYGKRLRACDEWEFLSEGMAFPDSA